MFERLTDEEVLPAASPRLMALALRHFIWEEAEKVAAMHSFVQPIADIAPETTLAAELYVLRLKLIAKAYRYLMGIEP